MKLQQSQRYRDLISLIGEAAKGLNPRRYTLRLSTEDIDLMTVTRDNYGRAIEPQTFLWFNNLPIFYDLNLPPGCVWVLHLDEAAAIMVRRMT